MKHGNLYWEIDMDFKDSEGSDFCSKTNANVRRYNFTSAWVDACEMYEAQINLRGNELDSFRLRLRFDDSGSHAFEILQSWRLLSLGKADEFFSYPHYAFKALVMI